MNVTWVAVDLANPTTNPADIVLKIRDAFNACSYDTIYLNFLIAWGLADEGDSCTLFGRRCGSDGDVDSLISWTMHLPKNA